MGPTRLTIAHARRFAGDFDGLYLVLPRPGVPAVPRPVVEPAGLAQNAYAGMGRKPDALAGRGISGMDTVLVRVFHLCRRCAQSASCITCRAGGAEEFPAGDDLLDPYMRCRTLRLGSGTGNIPGNDGASPAPWRG